MNPSPQRSIDFSIVQRMGGETTAHPAGAVIMSEGERRSQMFYVAKGRVTVMAKGRVVEEVGEGGIFGEMAMIDDGPRSATVMAKTDCEVVAVDERLFLVLVRQAPFFALDVMRTLVRRLRVMNEKLTPT
ncbi:MAG: cyclic nucleotide-binding domain-containing protein [Rhodospirillaceae bacterium]|nr:cyclic nucleotide-binding domain-containing protein [Rhodospirillaceae bacterium]